MHRKTRALTIVLCFSFAADLVALSPESIREWTEDIEQVGRRQDNIRIEALIPDTIVEDCQSARGTSAHLERHQVDVPHNARPVPGPTAQSPESKSSATRQRAVVADGFGSYRSSVAVTVSPGDASGGSSRLLRLGPCQLRQESGVHWPSSM